MGIAVFFVRIFVAVLVLANTSDSWAQAISNSPDRYRQDVAGARPQPAYDPLGVRLGSFVARLDGDFDIGYNSNILGRGTSIVGDSFYKMGSSLRLGSDWGRHDVSLDGNVALTRFFDRTDQNSNDFSFRGSARLDLANNLTLAPSVEYAREALPRGSSGNQLTEGEPVYLRRFSTSLSSRYDGRAMRVETLLVFRQLRFEPVKIDDVETSQRFRASDGIGGRVTLLYTAMPAVSALAQFVADDTENPRDEFCCDRNAHGFAVLGGIRFDTSGMIVGQAAMGYRKRYFEGSKTTSRGFIYDARIEWYPTQLITVTATADQQFQNSGIRAASAVLVGTQSITVDYELLRNLLVNVQAEHQSTRYREIDARGNLKSVAFRTIYTPRRMLQYSAFTKFRWNSSDRQAAVSSFRSVQMGLSVRIRL